MNGLCRHEQPSFRQTYIECKKKHIRCTTARFWLCEETRPAVLAIVVIIAVIATLALS